MRVFAQCAVMGLMAVLFAHGSAVRGGPGTTAGAQG